MINTSLVAATSPRVSPVIRQPDRTTKKVTVRGRELCFSSFCSRCRTRDPKIAVLVHQDCYLALQTASRQHGYDITGKDIWELAISLQAICPTSAARREERERACFNSFFSNLEGLLNAPQGQKPTLLDRLIRLPLELRQEIAVHSWRCRYQSLAVCFAQSSLLFGALQDFDATKRVESLDLAGPIYVTRLDIAGVPYISGFYTSNVPHTESLQNHDRCKAVVAWDDIGMLDMQFLTDTESGRRTQGALWYQTLEYISGATLQIRYKQLLIGSVHVSNNSESLLWDIPNPPNLRRHNMYNMPPRPSPIIPMRYVHLRNDSAGLTIACSRTGVVSIYTHSLCSRNKQSSRGSLDLDYFEDLVCIFFPLQARESITHLWVRDEQERFTCIRYPAIVIRTSLGKECTFGPYIKADARNRYYFSSLIAGMDESVTALCYNDLGVQSPIHDLALAITCTTGDSCHRSVVPSWPDAAVPRLAGTLNHDWYLSAASLDDVSRVEMLVYMSTKYVRIGALLYYTSGDVAALGECRINQALLKEFRSPIALHWSQSEEGYLQDINFLEESEETHFEDTFRSFPMRGNLVWWFSARGSKLEYMMDS
ncbi:hypothetical protein B0J12DRAFT_674189 [Macrophomina phaseolina]|uniref:Uncharacterized protein n=1 Tax=Macrophomina phaseolina TaxID=35725 RepID=A0ABQ8G4G3_9PEZI|nr:hypothetical protein B0J12DRAFT_674189 [Macrophomina phaseolina]